MPTRTLRAVLVFAALSLAASASAEELHLETPELGQVDTGGGQGFHQGTLLGGRTLGAGHDVLFGQVGWPGLSIAYIHGSTNKVDVGGQFTFAYGVEGTTATAPGLKFAGVIRLNMADKGKFNIGLRFDPGITMYFEGGRNGNGFVFGLAIPAALAFGVDVNDALMLNFGLALPMAIFFTPDVAFSLPIQPGFGLQYNVDSHLAITFDTAFGPDIIIGGGGSGTVFAFKTLIGVGYRL